MDINLIQYVLRLIESEQENVIESSGTEKSELENIKSVHINKSPFSNEFKKEVDIVTDINQIDYSRIERYESEKRRNKKAFTDVEKVLIEVFSRFPNEQYQDYGEVQHARYTDYIKNVRDTNIKKLEPVATLDTFIPKGFLIDNDFSDKNNLNNVYVNEKEKIVVWTIKGIDSKITSGNAYTDFIDSYRIVSKSLKYWATADYYTMANKIIEKYKIDRRGYKLYWSSHSRGAAIQLSLITLDWADPDLNPLGKELYILNDVTILDFAFYVDGVFLYNTGAPPWAFLYTYSQNSIYGKIKPEKVFKLSKILYLGFVKAYIPFVADILSKGAQEYPYGNQIYIEKKRSSVHDVVNFLPDYVYNFEPVSQPVIEPTLIKSAAEINSNIIQPNLIDQGPKEIIVEPVIDYIYQTNLINNYTNKLSNDIDIDTDMAGKGITTASGAYNKGLKDKISGERKKRSDFISEVLFSEYEKGINSGGRGDNLRKVALKPSLQPQPPQGPQPSQGPKIESKTEPPRTGPKESQHTESKAQKDYSNPNITTENKIKSIFSGYSIPDYNPRLKREPKLKEFSINKDGTLVKTLDFKDDKIGEFQRISKKRVDVHKGNKLMPPLLPEPVTGTKIKKEAKMKKPPVKKITKVIKAYKL